MHWPIFHRAPARRRRRGSTSVLFVLAAWLAPGAATASNASLAPRGGNGHVMPVTPPGTLPAAAPVTGNLVYYGGPVISNVEVVMVLWGSGTYQSFVQQTSSPSLATFYGGVTNSAYMDWLSEYDTNIVPAGGGSGTNQAIARGSFLAQSTITPSAAANGSTIDDTKIQTELVAQINAGHLPAPVTDGAGHVNTIYMIHFPSGKTITNGTSTSCVAGGFCAYHGTIATAGGDLYYGVLPDMSAGSGCDTGCGGGTPFANQTSVASHELIEAVTDPAVGVATTTAPPLSWYDTANGEIGDICNGMQGTVAGGDGVTYTVQKEWSNAAKACIVTRVTANDFSISLAPSARVIPRGTSTTYAVSTAVTSGSAQTVALSISALPAGLSATLTPTSLTAGGGATLAVSASAAAAAQTTAFTVTGTATSGSHSALASVTVLPALAIAPAGATRPPRGTQAFSASGGSGAGYTWSLATNASGGTIDAATGAYRAGPTGNVGDVVQVTDSLGGTASAAVAVTAGVSIGPGTATLAPRATQAFTASGGSGTGYAWSLATDASGGTIDAATGAYRAGPTGNVGDVVQVADSLGNTSSATVSVTAGVSIGPATATLGPKGKQAFTATGGSGAGYSWSLATDASGGTIDAATGAYQAGPKGSVSDVVQVGDSLGNTATAKVSVTAAPSGCGCGAAGGPGASWLALGGLLALARRRRRA